MPRESCRGSQAHPRSSLLLAQHHERLVNRSDLCFEGESANSRNAEADS
jgi:hypothetical protein